MPCRSFEDVFAAVAEGRATRGILPMENSIGGSIHRNYDLLVEHELPIVGEVEIAVDHCLLVRPGTRLEDLTVVYSHPQALAQCEQYLARISGVEIVAVYDTAGGAKMVAEGDRADAGAVASRRAAEVFGLEIAAEKNPGLRGEHYALRADRPDACAGRGSDQDLASSSRCRARRVRSTRRSAASLCATSTSRSSNHVRFAGGPWEYMFYVDVDVARQSLECARAITHLGEFARWVRTLGSYPRLDAFQTREG